MNSDVRICGGCTSKMIKVATYIKRNGKMTTGFLQIPRRIQ